MTNKEFLERLNQYLKKDSYSIDTERAILLDFKNSGGTQVIAKKLVEELALEVSDNEVLQDRVYDILDIITGWCSSEIKVWD